MFRFIVITLRKVFVFNGIVILSKNKIFK